MALIIVKAQLDFYFSDSVMMLRGWGGGGGGGSEDVTLIFYLKLIARFLVDVVIYIPLLYCC